MGIKKEKWVKVLGSSGRNNIGKLLSIMGSSLMIVPHMIVTIINSLSVGCFMLGIIDTWPQSDHTHIATYIMHLHM